ncbi:hypothetical protein A2U01_0070543, partial [Trifolium medium]|nr:hypothetical protein [Trifolium medium]
LVWYDDVWTIWTSRNDTIFAGGSSTIDNLMDMVIFSSWKWLLGKNPDSPAPSMSGRCNLYCVGPVRQGEDMVPGFFRF